MTDLFDVIEWDKCQFVMYSEDKKGNTQVHYHTPLIYIPSTSDTRPAFYSVKSSKFGVSVRPEATHWAICLMDDLRNEVLFEGPLPGVYEYITVDLSDEKDITILRYNQFLKFSVGTKLNKRFHTTRNKRFTQIF